MFFDGSISLNFDHFSSRQLFHVITGLIKIYNYLCELLIEIETHFKIEISNLEAENIHTIQDYYEIILKKADISIPNEEVLQSLKILIAEKVGIDLKQLNLETNIVNDLGLD